MDNFDKNFEEKDEFEGGIDKTDDIEDTESGFPPEDMFGDEEDSF
ncbi:MAG: hypothetical protein NUV47_01450 [Patescibacteria group bacterium]|nr:hypothetical protein [Patescibacteria group bacterium]